MKWRFIVGLILIILNFLWGHDFVQKYYKYHYLKKSFLFMFPDWILYVNILGSIAGILLATIIIKERIKILPGVITNIILFVAIALLTLQFGTTSGFKSADGKEKEENEFLR